MENSSVLVIGIGAVGSAFLENSIGFFKKVGVFDGDIISKNNLSNQPFYRDCDLALPTSKVPFALKKIGTLDTATEYKAYERYFTRSDFEIMKDYDLILDFTDNIKSRLIINEGCVKMGKQGVFVSLNEKEGLLYFYRKGACFNCILRNSAGHIKEGCESITSAPEKDFLEFLTQNIFEFYSDKTDGGKIKIFSLKTKKVLSSAIKQDPECEVCVKHVTNKVGNEFLQICSSGIKFSYGKEVDLNRLSSLLNGSKLYGEHLLFNNENKSILISAEGDFLFTGYTKDEAESLLSFCIS